MQLAIDFTAPRESGRTAGERCTEKAERVASFDTDGAAAFIVEHLRQRGPTSGEDLTDAAIAAGFTVHDARAYGPVYAKLARRGAIKCVGYCERRRGHGTAGGRVWGIA